MTAVSAAISVSEEHIKMVQQEHAVVYEAIEAHNGDSAREQMRAPS